MQGLGDLFTFFSGGGGLFLGGEGQKKGMWDVGSVTLGVCVTVVSFVNK